MSMGTRVETDTNIIEGNFINYIVLLTASLRNTKMRASIGLSGDKQKESVR